MLYLHWNQSIMKTRVTDDTALPVKYQNSDFMSIALLNAHVNFKNVLSIIK